MNVNHANSKHIHCLVNDDSEESDRPKRKKSKSHWNESEESEDSEASWKQKKKRYQFCHCNQILFALNLFLLFIVDPKKYPSILSMVYNCLCTRAPINFLFKTLFYIVQSDFE